MTIVGGPSVLVPRCPVGRPIGSFDVSGFARMLVLQTLKRCFTEVSSRKSSKTYKKWDPAYQQTALDMAFEKGSDRVVASMLRQMFPKVFGDVYESHIRHWQESAENLINAKRN